MRYRLFDLELSRAAQPVQLQPDEAGFGIVGRWHGRPIGFHMEERPAGSIITVEDLTAIADRHFAAGLLTARVEGVLPPPPPAPPVILTIAICTRNRAVRLNRLLKSLEQLIPEPLFGKVEILVVDNGSTDGTREAVAAFPAVRYVHERLAGLNFARNAALSQANGHFLTYFDDDVVVDAGWLQGLAAAYRSRPDAGGFSGLVLPFRLDTVAQQMFERRGGFGRGFRRIEFRGASHANSLFPVGAGSVGAGCNMVFDRQLLLELGGFDEALDTGAPLPGGGDLDIFYRVLRSGRPMVYEPRCAVHHEHRETLPELKRQYHSWGLGLMAFVAKSSRTDPAFRQRHRKMVVWWFGDQAKALLRSFKRWDLVSLRFSLAEFRGGIAGLAGEYGRSQKRVAAIRANAA